jgi:hypothetical protein
MTSIFRLAGLACTVALTCASAQAAETFAIVQDKPELVHIDLGVDGGSHGDMLAFEAGFTTEDGQKGIMSGIIVTVGIPDAEGTYFDRVGNIVLDFGGSDSLVVGGHSTYPVGVGEIAVDAPQVRAIVGGTGRFIGARGQVTTTRRDAGHYDHTIELVD